MATYLDKILQWHRDRADADDRDFTELVSTARAATAERPRRGFRRALDADSGLSVIAEVKRRSPSKGPLNVELDVAALVGEYAQGGAAALSVLTDSEHFGGSRRDLQVAKESVALPVLRKDFTVSAADVCDAALMGADCVLLIVAALSDAELSQFAELASDLGLDALVECHDSAEVERALQCCEATLIGVNQRDLVTFEVDTERAVRTVDSIPRSAVKVAESGIATAGDARTLAAAGFDAVLVGEALVTTGEPAAGVRSLRIV